uniref:helix-turn-helix domain-containing protein n=1 Tax=Actinoplanes sp. CA-151224 TaxID=3239904 RepID=UPI003F499B73
MGQRRADLTPERSPLHLWGYELRAWRDRRGLSLSQLASKIYYDAAHLGKFERGERAAPLRVAEACDRELGTGGALVRLWPGTALLIEPRPDEAKTPADEANRPAPIASALGEAQWSGVGDDVELSVPALTPDGRTILVRFSRRDILRSIGVAATSGALSLMPYPELRDRIAHSRESGTVDLGTVACIRDALGTYRRTEDITGGVQLWPIVQGQLQAVTDLIPKSSGKVLDDVLSLAAEHAHWLSWVAFGEKNPGAALAWLDHAHGWATEAGAFDLVSWIARVKSTYALSGGDPVRAQRSAQLASRLSNNGSPSARSIAANAEALAAAALGNFDQARRLGDEAYAHAQQAPEAGDRPSWLYWLDPVRAELQRADTAYAVQDWDDAAALYSSNLPALLDYPRDYAYYAGRLATARAQAS